jgi:hypothetical protein
MLGKQVLVTTVRHVLRFHWEGKASKYGGELQIYWISSCGKPQGVVFQLVGWKGVNKSLQKLNLLWNCLQCLKLGTDPLEWCKEWKMDWDLEHVILEDCIDQGLWRQWPKNYGSVDRFSGSTGSQNGKGRHWICGEVNFTCGKWTENYRLGTGFFVHKRIILEVKRVEFVSDRMSDIVLRGCWCDIIGLNVHASPDNKRDDSKDSLYEE